MRLFSILYLGLFIAGCKTGAKNDSDSFEYKDIHSTSVETESAPNQPSNPSSNLEVEETIPIDMDNKGIGPIKRVRLGRKIDEELSQQGESLFSTYCTACHIPGRKLIGPDVTGVYERRSPEWVMNLLLNPTQMLAEDPIAMALLEKHNNIPMLDQGLNEEQARAIVEYMRTLN